MAFDQSVYVLDNDGSGLYGIVEDDTFTPFLVALCLLLAVSICRPSVPGPVSWLALSQGHLR